MSALKRHHAKHVSDGHTNDKNGFAMDCQCYQAGWKAAMRYAEKAIKCSTKIAHESLKECCEAYESQARKK